LTTPPYLFVVIGDLDGPHGCSGRHHQVNVVAELAEAQTWREGGREGERGAEHMGRTHSNEV